ncbi:MAG: homoserine kinase [SAR86 cluster bacterium]|uniref:Homoserine kinase n=1 Tax=SAR86 cluster bacterium TaxID=2030880 RepID=A0A972VXY2_9GAMM|nr:homoserine kinase [SAR86 cluster bacterium]
MAAFTSFSESALSRYLCMFELGELVSCSPIAAGIENSNYFVNLQADDVISEYVLTINEGLSFKEAPFFSQLLSQLARAGIPVPAPKRTLDGMSSTIFCGKPTWLFPKLAGAHPQIVNYQQCHQIGQALANLHAAASGVSLTRSNPYDLAWATATVDQLSSRLAIADQQLLRTILAEHREIEHLDLPTGIVHGDLFRDNALFIDDTLTGIIDFYHACQDNLIQDLAITVNDWCSDSNGQIDSRRKHSLIEGYESVRPLTSEEREALTSFQRVGALRFILTRLLSGEGDAYLKDPEEFLRIARQLG